MLETKLVCFTLATIALLQLSTCSKETNVLAPGFNDSLDTSIIITEFPTTLQLLAGHSITIANLNTTITFLGVVQDTRTNTNGRISGNAVVRLGFTYSTFYKVIELNTDTIPRTYDWEDGQNYDIDLKGLSLSGNTYQMAFEINQFFYL